MKIRFLNECIGEKDQKICSIPFSVEIDYPRTSEISKAARVASGQRDIFVSLCPFVQWEALVKFLREWHPYADHEAALRKIREAMKAAEERYMSQQR